MSEAPSAARYFVASPLIAPVRSCPSAKASMIALSEPLWLSNRMSSGAAPLACAQVFVPTKPSSAKVAPIACSVWCPPQMAWVFTMFSALPAASSASARSNAAIAPFMSMRRTTSASVIQRLTASPVDLLSCSPRGLSSRHRQKRRRPIRPRGGENTISIEGSKTMRRSVNAERSPRARSNTPRRATADQATG